VAVLVAVAAGIVVRQSSAQLVAPARLIHNEEIGVDLELADALHHNQHQMQQIPGDQQRQPSTLLALAFDEGADMFAADIDV